MNSSCQMLKQINILDFTITDLCLYLDTHPYDRKALEYFTHYNRILSQLKSDFSRMYYPLSLNYVDSEKEWSWGSAPLPWEGGNE